MHTTQVHRFKVDKLVRDKVPEIMRTLGIKVSERVMAKDKYIKRLKDKLLEDANEVLASSSEQEMREELSDLLEVTLALLKAYKMEFTNIQQAADQKREEKGGFEKKIYHSFVEVEEGNPSLAYYESQPNKYPKLHL